MTTKTEFTQRVLKGIDSTIAKLEQAKEQAKSKQATVYNGSEYWFELQAKIDRYSKDIKQLQASKQKYQ